ncbi:hypothetical protein [Nocardioides sp. Soil777]|uniref:hypothetical protein n=1 Tax=Nocardioides sp. Soil777 TaxID=1736409 RepID=UPI000AE1810D|nr:hypothetical protein [Nocardioides sp. Soil777]
MSGQGEAGGGATDLPAALPLVGAATVVALALTEHFEALPAALAAYVSAYLLLRDG